MSSSTRWKHRPPGSTWGDFGPDDQLGRMNLLTAEKVRQGIAEVHEGLTFNLSLCSIRVACRRCCAPPCAMANPTSITA
jgi:hypothetical protein